MVHNNKRVYCLYRVSTLGQVEKDDIPMQRQCCREFAEANAWEIVEEKVEKGVSGFKVSAKDRDAIQEIQKDAVLSKFDILLVFMFDRLGRKDDETPFVVEWFIRQGIEVWSVKEGEQRLDTHVDKLTNYIRYWQASGESLKTSIRTKTRLAQIVQDGRFKGGVAPYGYKLVGSGIINKRNHEVSELQIDENEAPIVQRIFDLYINEGYGTLRICNYLRAEGIKNRKGDCFTNPTIQHMLKNLTYTGVLRCGESHSDVLPHLQLIDEGSFRRTQELLVERSNKCRDSMTPRSTKGQSLFSRNIFCGHCGARLVLTTNGMRRVTDEDGVIREVPKTRYICYNKTRHHNCDGQTGYTVSKLDGVVDKLILALFERIKDTPPSDLLSTEFQRRQNTVRAALGNAKSSHAKHQKEYSAYKSEIFKALQGESNFSSDILGELLTASKTAMDEASEIILKRQQELDNSNQLYLDSRQKLDTLTTWADLYQNSSTGSKRMILSQLIQAVRVRRDYDIEIDFNISFEQYCNGFFQ